VAPSYQAPLLESWGENLSKGGNYYSLVEKNGDADPNEVRSKKRSELVFLLTNQIEFHNIMILANYLLINPK